MTVDNINVENVKTISKNNVDIVLDVGRMIILHVELPGMKTLAKPVH